ncbi:helix-turn-helix domain-containing protein [Streptomyces sp. NPDC101145]|uniref:helix-turn-helix domain-containing protein n=1 Tax=Streptomyces sp. NPDC101145 TaxID=3366112 RepID=UPI00382E13F3
MPYTDPPGMPEGERMTDAEFKVIREFLGLTGDWLAAHLGVSPRTVRHWEAGKYAIPDGVRIAIEELEVQTAEFIDGVVDKLRDSDADGLVTYRTDEEYHAAHPDVPFPASWHRAVIARIVQEVPGMAISYASDAGANDAPVGA